MTEETKNGSGLVDPRQNDRLANWVVRFVQVFFLAVALWNVDAPFLSAHNERQNQTFDMARHIYREGWSSVITPKVSYVLPGFEKLHYTAMLLDFPFHGVIAWPLMYLTSHERAVMRLISTAFSLAAIQFLYLMLRFWLPPLVSAIGTTIWATAPLVLHFGQVPMPDILCTTGILAAFWFALRGKLPLSSGCFLFAILAKVSVIVFGLPILVALLVTRECKTWRDATRVSILWGWLPLLGIVLWMGSLTWFAPPTSMSVGVVIADRGGLINLVLPWFYKLVLGCLFPFGIGALGFVGVLFSVCGTQVRMDWRVKWAIIVSNLAFLVFVLVKVTEPQYLLPVLPWVAIASAFGLNYLGGKLRDGNLRRTAIMAAVLLHVPLAVAFATDLKVSRVPDFAEIESAAKLVPPGARVLVVYRYYGASPAVWLDRNVLAINSLSDLKQWPRLQAEGFDHVLILDMAALHDFRSKENPSAWLNKIIPSTQMAATTGTTKLESDYTNPGSPFRQYCDQHFTPVFVAPHTVLYSIPTEAHGDKP